ncbi:Transcriptional regulator, MarR family [Pediococcus damnosus]|uniref:Transcriptional regulator, MarR family n=3 Tax=Pediococcus damnosus TaxID=51663 RepID=A0AAC9B476_9LACO|nr:MarR family transcriptional regulator [Pediococcus damnosus]AMV63608.1 Transcriptional regulator, MarR family [Pediococcus damnosus]AMV66451.1 Transcriptional regulator, MarR family [Pediococcus damnosus]AMV68754.1 Transcriptional regulator, MarR family [Pediococcus damnosus]KJU73557.1 MarR family transcriptional regulator [Pediococcus damnosus LMG 28219]PIO80524.1 MarR family transcriptional regulator [Pediococcus damnosus]
MNNTGYLLMNISKKLKYNLNSALADLDITAQQWSIIQQLHHFNDAKLQVTANQLATILDMDKPTISAIIKRLTIKKIIYKKKNNQDSRAFDLSLSQKGTEIYTKAVIISDKVLTQFMKQLTQAEKHDLNQILQKLNREK